MRLDVIQYASEGASSRRLTERLVRALRRSGYLFRMDIVTDPELCREAGVRQLPAYALNGQLMAQGRVPEENELPAQIEQAAAACGVPRQTPPSETEEAAKMGRVTAAPLSRFRPNLKHMIAACPPVLLMLIPILLFREQDAPEIQPGSEQGLQNTPGNESLADERLLTAPCKHAGDAAETPA